MEILYLIIKSLVKLVVEIIIQKIGIQKLLSNK
ncbi:hypothetical protein Xszus_04093 [Xenorhabdus szentirmaii]|nr:hypothetical protein Xsze_01919 [Xenorhabdus szentirmaii DSM 16338]PHM44263.1 hypothetical protein Xszus_04093 [Xenorhabdus szentirmaii]